MFLFARTLYTQEEMNNTRTLIADEVVIQRGACIGAAEINLSLRSKMHRRTKYRSIEAAPPDNG